MDRNLAEDKMVAAMLKAISKGSQPVDVFCSWLLAVTGAAASLVITQADEVRQILSPSGLLWCESFLFLCCFFGVGAKFFALLCTITVAVSEATVSEVASITSEYFSSPENMNQLVTPDDNVRQFLTGVFEKFVLAQPTFSRWIARIIIRRQMRKDLGNPCLLYIPLTRYFYAQCGCMGLQILMFMAFLIVGFSSGGH
jgi:hypothetical protein